MKFYVWCTTISEQSERMRKGEYIINIFQNISFAFHFSQETRGRLDPRQPYRGTVSQFEKT